MTTFTKIGLGLIGSLIIGTPAIYNNKLNKFLVKEQNLLNGNGVLFIETSKKNLYFKTEKVYNLKLNDSSFLIKNFYPSVSDDIIEELKKLLDGMEFKIELSVLNYPIYHRDAIKMKLTKLSSQNIKELQKTKKGRELLQFIQNGGLETILDIDTMKIVKLKQKDIDLTLKDKNGNLNIKLLKLNGEFTKNPSFNFKTFSITDNNSIFKIDNFSYSIDKTNILNNNANLNIKSFYLKDNNTNLKLDNIKLDSSVKTILNKTSILTNLSVDSIITAIKQNYLKLKNLKLNINFSQLNSNVIKKLIDNSQTNQLSEMELINLSNKLLNNGFVISISPFSFEKTEVKVENQIYKIEPFSLKIINKINKNDYNLQNSPNYLLKFIKTDILIETTQKNIDLISQFNPMIPVVVKNIAQYNNNKIQLKFEYQNGKITSNGHSIF